MSHDQPLIYLDHNATTPVAPEVLDAAYGNPSSDSVSDPTRRRMVTTVVEHPATTAPLAHLHAAGWTITALPVTSAGTVDPAAAARELGPDVALVTMMLAQSETGAILPVPTVAAAAREVGAVVHTDAAQAIGKVEVNVDALAVDLLSIAGHKCYAPKGVGALYRRAGTPLSSVLLAAGQEGGVRPGTENVPSNIEASADLRPRRAPPPHCASPLTRSTQSPGPHRFGSIREPGQDTHTHRRHLDA